MRIIRVDHSGQADKKRYFTFETMMQLLIDDGGSLPVTKDTKLKMELPESEQEKRKLATNEGG